MQRLTTAVFLTVAVLVNAPALLEANQHTAIPTPSPQRYDTYLAPQYGLRFVYPEGYRVSVPLAYPLAEDPQGQQLVIELWREEDYVPWGRADIENPGGTEPPANIQIVVMANPTGRSLESWVELATSQPEVITVAGRGAIAYSATGLYESDVVLLPTPDNRAVVKISAGYADPRDPLRQVFQTVVSSLAFDSSAAIGEFNEIDYRPLQTLLAAGDWQRADLETRAILMQLAGSYDFFYPHIEPAGVANLPCEDLQILDALWSRYSDGRFGFRAQQTQWKAIPASALTQRAEGFGQAVGWRTPSAPDSGFASRWKTDTELVFAATAPTGHLPWAGINSMTLDRMVQASGPDCGTCTIDAMYLSSDRFADYLNVLFARVEDYLCDAATSAN